MAKGLCRRKGYRNRQEQSLTSLGLRVADRVRRNKRPFTLEAMRPMIVVSFTWLSETAQTWKPTALVRARPGGWWSRPSAEVYDAWLFSSSATSLVT